MQPHPVCFHARMTLTTAALWEEPPSGCCEPQAAPQRFPSSLALSPLPSLLPSIPTAGSPENRWRQNRPCREGVKRAS